jgi:hypothetical protein
MGGYSGSVVNPAQLAAVIPPYATMAPKPEAGAPAAGMADGITRPDHQHPRVTATARGTLDASGVATVVFTQAFDSEPAISIISVGAKQAGTAIPDFDFTFTTDAGGKFTGGTVYGRRARKLPTQPLATGPLAAAALLTGVIAGINAIASSITGYDATEVAAGSGYSLIAVKSSASVS